jgi:hypothetical protein
MRGRDSAVTKAPIAEESVADPVYTTWAGASPCKIILVSSMADVGKQSCGVEAGLGGYTPPTLHASILVSTMADIINICHPSHC